MSEATPTPDPSASSDEQAENPGSAFPGAGPEVSDEDRDEALEEMPDGNATEADAVDTDAVDSRAHD